MGLDVTAVVGGADTTEPHHQPTTGGRSRRVTPEEELVDRGEAGTPGDPRHRDRRTGRNPRRVTSGWSSNSLALATAHLVSTLIGKMSFSYLSFKGCFAKFQYFDEITHFFHWGFNTLK